jgi:hypothetical protein
VIIGDSPSKYGVGAKTLRLKTIWLTTDTRETEADGADAIAKMPKDILGILKT